MDAESTSRNGDGAEVISNPWTLQISWASFARGQGLRISGLELRNSFGSRPSGFGLSLSLPDLPWFDPEAFGGIAGIDEARGPIDQFLIVDVLVCGGDDHGVECAHALAIPGDRLDADPVTVFARGADHRDMG